MTEKKYKWVQVAASAEELSIAAGTVIEVDAEGKTICMARQGEQLFAFAAKCPHAGGRFVHGAVGMAGNVICPLHRYKFCLKNGRNITGEGYYLKHWPVEVREEGVFVGLEASAWTFF